MILLNQLIEELISAKNDSEKELDPYQKIFVKKLTKMFPKELKLYHSTDAENVQSILKNGLSINENSRNGSLFFVLGDPSINRVGGDDISTLEVTVFPNEYHYLYPEDETYYDAEDMKIDPNDPESEIDPDKIFLMYMKAHPYPIGGDIVLDCDVPPERIKLLPKTKFK